MLQSKDELKRFAARFAADQFVKDKMRIGVGTGSTVRYFIERLIERTQNEKLQLRAVATSKASEELLLEGGIPILSPDEIQDLEIGVDGADEVDESLTLIKGGGGALLREKIIASHCNRWYVIVDETKWSQKLGRAKLPVEVLPFYPKLTLSSIEKVGCKGHLRKNNDGSDYITDNGNFIYDVILPQEVKEIEELSHTLSCIPGVVANGIFSSKLVDCVITAYADGHVQVKENR